MEQGNKKIAYRTRVLKFDWLKKGEQQAVF